MFDAFARSFQKSRHYQATTQSNSISAGLDQIISHSFSFPHRHTIRLTPTYIAHKMKRRRPESLPTLQTGKIHKLPGETHSRSIGHHPGSSLADVSHLLLSPFVALARRYPPVRVYYNLPGSHYSYTTTLATPQDVFIHRQPRIKVGSITHLNGRSGVGRDDPAGKRRRVDGGEVDADLQQGRETVSGHATDETTSVEREFEGDREQEDQDEEDGEVYMGSVSLRAIVRAICRAR